MNKKDIEYSFVSEIIENFYYNYSLITKIYRYHSNNRIAKIVSKQWFNDKPKKVFIKKYKSLKELYKIIDYYDRCNNHIKTLLEV